MVFARDCSLASGETWLDDIGFRNLGSGRRIIRIRLGFLSDAFVFTDGFVDSIEVVVDDRVFEQANRTLYGVLTIVPSAEVVSVLIDNSPKNCREQPLQNHFVIEQLADGPVELFQILKDDAVKVLHSICQQI